MKKCLSLLLAVLLLTGCSGQGSQNSQQDTQPQPKSLYDAAHVLEQQTTGAVRVHVLEGNDYVTVQIMGSKALLLTESGEAVVLNQDGAVTATGQLKGYSTQSAAFDVSVQGVANYLPDSREVVLYNPQLQPNNRIVLPENIQGEPLISLESNEIFYCCPGEIRALNMENGVARLLKSHTAAEQKLTGCYFDGKLLSWEFLDASGSRKQIYLSGENGTTLSDDSYVYEIQTFEDRHFVRRRDNWLDQTIVGTYAGESKLLQVSQETADFVTGALAMNGAVSYKKTAAGITLSFHDIGLGQTTAQVALEGIQEPVALAADSGYIWVLAQETQSQEPGRQVLLRWDVTKSPAQSQEAVTAMLYTWENPDVEGLQLCKQRAAEMEKTYGVKITLWEDVRKRTGGYAVREEYQPAILHDMLDKLEPALKLYPKDFLRKTVKSGWIRIGLVRTIEGGEDWVQFWENGDCYLLISSQADIASAFVQAVGYAVDSRVLGNSRAYDTWDTLNPKNFVYTSEAEGKTQDVAAYMDGESRAFVNMQSVSSASEDRRQIWIAAIAQGNQSVFGSETMQGKLRCVCQGIREAYSLEKVKDALPWEQYLKEPLAPAS